MLELFITGFSKMSNIAYLGAISPVKEQLLVINQNLNIKGATLNIIQF